MGLRLVNNAPGVTSGPVKPNQKLFFGFKSETLSIDLSTVNVHAGFSGIKNKGLLPESDPSLEGLATVSLDTSELRRPESGVVSKSFAGSSLVLTKSTNSPNERCVYSVTVPIVPGASVLGHFTFRKKNAWSQTNPDWCNLTNMTGVYLGIEHGTFNTAAYAFLRNNGATGSIVFGGPLQGYNLARGAQTELAASSVSGGAGWMSLADNSQLTVFIRMNTFVTPYRAELWTMVTGAAPVLQGTVPIGTLGTFPSSSFTNRRDGTSETATLFFGNIGQSGDVLQLDEWAIYPDFATLVQNGQSLPHATRNVIADGLVSYDVTNSELPSATDPARWFEVSGAGTQPPNPELNYQPGYKLRPQYLGLSKSTSDKILYERQEPRIEQLDGSMVEAVIYGTSVSRLGDLVGPGFTLEDGVNSFKVVALETTSKKSWGIASSNALFSTESGYYTPTTDADFRSPKLVRLIVDRIRDHVQLEIDEELVVDRQTNGPALLVSGPQAGTTTLSGNTLSIDVSDDGGVSYTTQSHTFPANLASISAIVAALNGDVAFVGSGSKQLQAIDRGTTFAIRTVSTGELMKLVVNPASTALGGTALSLTASQSAVGQTSALPAAPDSIGRVQFGFPFEGNYSAEMKLRSIAYMPRFSAWDTSDSLLPDSTNLPAAIQFSLFSQGSTTSAISESALSILKSDFASSLSKRFYQRDEAFSDQGTVVVDFKAHVSAFTNNTGQVNAPNTATGAGLTVFLGTKRVFLGFYDCGLLGRRIGIVPGSGSEDDILTQTELGARFSGEVNWTIANKYRLLIRPYKDIQVWSGSVLNEPLIRIPWRNDTDGFDLPLDTTNQGLAFGHFNYHVLPSSTTSVWTHVRWGFSNGYDMSTSKVYSNGIPSYAFGGNAFILSEFDES